MFRGRYCISKKISKLRVLNKIHPIFFCTWFSKILLVTPPIANTNTLCPPRGALY